MKSFKMHEAKLRHGDQVVKQLALLKDSGAGPRLAARCLDGYEACLLFSSTKDADTPLPLFSTEPQPAYVAKDCIASFLGSAHRRWRPCMTESAPT